MPDISMCSGLGCPLKDKCYRYTATPSEFWQSYFTEVPYVEVTNVKEPECEYFWDNEEDKSDD